MISGGGRPVALQISSASSCSGRVIFQSSKILGRINTLMRVLASSSPAVKKENSYFFVNGMKQSGFPYVHVTQFHTCICGLACVVAEVVLRYSQNAQLTSQWIHSESIK